MIELGRPTQWISSFFVPLHSLTSGRSLAPDQPADNYLAPLLRIYISILLLEKPDNTPVAPTRTGSAEIIIIKKLLRLVLAGQRGG